MFLLFLVLHLHFVFGSDNKAVALAAAQKQGLVIVQDDRQLGILFFILPF